MLVIILLVFQLLVIIFISISVVSLNFFYLLIRVLLLAGCTCHVVTVWLLMNPVSNNTRDFPGEFPVDSPVHYVVIPLSMVDPVIQRSPSPFPSPKFPDYEFNLALCLNLSATYDCTDWRRLRSPDSGATGRKQPQGCPKICVPLLQLPPSQRGTADVLRTLAVRVLCDRAV